VRPVVSRIGRKSTTKCIRHIISDLVETASLKNRRTNLYFNNFAVLNYGAILYILYKLNFFTLFSSLLRMLHAFPILSPLACIVIMIIDTITVI
jgi:hypothetical protein